MKRVLLSFLAIQLFIMSEGTGLCQDEDKAKEHFLKGKAFVEEGACDKAIIELKASYDLKPSPLVLYNIAICYDELHQYASAMKYFKRFLVEAVDADQKTKSAVADRIKELSSFLGTLDLKVAPDGAEVFVDGESVGVSPIGPVLLETGEHKVLAKKGGFVDVPPQTITMVSGETKTLAIDLKKEEAKAIDAKVAGVAGGDTKAGGGKAGKGGKTVKMQETAKKPKKKLNPAAFYACVGLTAAAALGAVFTGAFALKKSSDVEGMYDDDPGWKKTYDAGERLAVATDVLIGVSAAAAAATIGLAFFTDFKKGKQEKKTSLVFSPALANGSIALGIGGAF